jgi:hypothetical protein
MREESARRCAGKREGLGLRLPCLVSGKQHRDDL